MSSLKIEPGWVQEQRLPTGWEWLTFQQAVEPISDEGKRIDQRDYQTEGALPVVDQGEAFIGGYTNDISKSYAGPLPIVVFGDHTRRVKLVEFAFAIGAQGVKLLRPRECWFARFFAYLLPTLPIPDRGYGRHYQYVRTLRFPRPPLDEQQRIVAEIEKQFTRLEAGVGSLKRVQAALKRQRASVLKAACEGRLVPTEAELARRESRSYEPATTLLARILEERRTKWTGRGEYEPPTAPNTEGLRSLSDGWTWASVNQLSTVVRGASPRPAGDPRYFGGNVPWITVGPITADTTPYLKTVPDTLNEAGREHSRYIEPHTFLLTNSGATLGVPKITLIGGCINDGVAALLDVGYPLKLYLLYFLRTQTNRLRGLNQGAAQPNLNTTLIKAIEVPLPPLAEQQRIVTELERRLSVIEELETVMTANLQRAVRLRQSVLHRAFQGELISRTAPTHVAANPPHSSCIRSR